MACNFLFFILMLLFYFQYILFYHLFLHHILQSVQLIFFISQLQLTTFQEKPISQSLISKHSHLHFFHFTLIYCYKLFYLINNHIYNYDGMKYFNTFFLDIRSRVVTLIFLKESGKQTLK